MEFAAKMKTGFEIMLTLKVNVSPGLMQSLTESCNSILTACAHEDILKLVAKGSFF